MEFKTSGQTDSQCESIQVPPYQLLLNHTQEDLCELQVLRIRKQSHTKSEEHSFLSYTVQASMARVGAEWCKCPSEARWGLPSVLADPLGRQPGIPYKLSGALGGVSMWCSKLPLCWKPHPKR